MDRKSILVIGAGLGGLAVGARLQREGHRVTVVEKNSFPGGRCGILESHGYRFDTGPTLLLMPDVLQSLFRALGRDLADYVELRRLDPNYRLCFDDGSSFDFSSDGESMRRTLEEVEPGAAAAYDAFLAEAGFNYRTAREHFVERNFVRPGEFFTPSNLKLLFRMHAHRRLYGRIARLFRDSRLRQAFSFQTMYLGLSPFSSPALYSLLPYTELTEGIWYPMGGMHRIATAIAQALEEDGGEIRYEAPVTRIMTDGRRATGAVLQNGEEIRADLVITNADLPWAKENLLPPNGSRDWRFTSSGFLMHLGLDRRYEEIPHHTVVFSSDYRRNFREIFRYKTLPKDPAFYICRPTATDPSVAPEGCDTIYVLAPMPHLGGDVDWNVAGSVLRERFLDRMEALGMKELRSAIRVEKHWTPRDFRDRLNLSMGCAFGLSHDITQVGYLRPHNRDSNLDNLYYVGASTHPGTGVPMVLFSAALVEERIAKEWAA